MADTTLFLSTTDAVPEARLDLTTVMECPVNLTPLLTYQGTQPVLQGHDDVGDPSI